MLSKFEENHNEEEPIQDEEARKDLQTLSSRLYDLKERFVKIVHKINADLNDYNGQISSDDQSENEISTNEADSNMDKDNEHKQKCLIKYILSSKARRYEYLKHVIKYPKIVNYLINDDKSDSARISRRDLEPFIQNHVEKNPTAQIYDKIAQQLADIRQSYSNNHSCE